MNNLVIMGFVLLIIPPEFHCVIAGEKLNITKLLMEILSRPDYPSEMNEPGELLITPYGNAYLPETDYLDEYEIDQMEQQPVEFVRTGRNMLPNQEYRNLCEIVTRKIQMGDSEFEYQPPYYHEVYCKSHSLFDPAQRNPTKTSKQRCAHPAFHCVQRSRTLFMVRRRWDGDCWEPFTKEIASGCDCMWPSSSLGEISAHY